MLVNDGRNNVKGSGVEFERDKCALLVIDMQNDFTKDHGVYRKHDGKFSNTETNRLLQRINAIIYTMHALNRIYALLK